MLDRNIVRTRKLRHSSIFVNSKWLSPKEYLTRGKTRRRQNIEKQQNRKVRHVYKTFLSRFDSNHEMLFL